MDVIRDIVRACLVIAVMAAAAALVVEVRFQLAAIDTARAVAAGQPVAYAAPQPAGQPGPLRRLGRATLDLADAAVGLVR